MTVARPRTKRQPSRGQRKHLSRRPALSSPTGTIQRVSGIRDHTGRVDPQAILQLQGVVGNRAVSKMMVNNGCRRARPAEGGEGLIQRVTLPSTSEIKSGEGGIWLFKKVSKKYKTILRHLANYHSNAGKINVQQDLLAMLIRDIDAWHKMKKEGQKKSKKKKKPDKRAGILSNLKIRALERKNEILKILVSEEQEEVRSKSQVPLSEEQLQIPGRHLKYLVPIGQLEKDDPQHREAIILHQYLSFWDPGDGKKKWDLTMHGPPPRHYYDWVTEQEQKWDADLADLVRSHIYTKVIKPPGGLSRDEYADNWIEDRLKAGEGELIPRIQYLQAGDDPQAGREKYRMSFNGTQLSNNEGNFEQNKRYIFAMSSEMEFFGTREHGLTTLERHHSSFFSGQGVGSAGVFIPSSNINVSVGSGHYHPTQQHLVNALLGLKHNRVSLEEVTARPVFDDESIKLHAPLYLKLIDIMRSMPAPLVRFIKFSSSWPDIKNAIMRYAFDEDFAVKATNVINVCDDDQIEGMSKVEK